MITKLYLAANAVNGSGPLGHLQLVAQTDTGELRETEVQSPGFLGLDWNVRFDIDHTLTVGYGDPNLYKIIELDLGGRNANDVWNVVQQAAADIDSYFTPYAVFSNSNSYIKTLMDFMGIDLAFLLADVTPPAVTTFPGAETDVALRFDDPITYKVLGTSGYDFLNGGNGEDIFIGNGGNDTLFGGAGSDTLVGGYALFNNDKTLNTQSLIGDEKRDGLLGGAGVDKYYVIDDQNWGHQVSQFITLQSIIPKLDHISDSDALGEVMFSDGSQIEETVWVQTAYGFANITKEGPYFLVQSGNLLVYSFGNDEGGYYGESTAKFTFDLNFAAVNAMYLGMTFTSAMNQHIGNDSANTLTGNAGRDYLNGNGGNDTIAAGSGDDVAEGGSGDDTLNGDDGSDNLLGGDGNDQLNGGNGNDALRGENGDDILDGGGGTDTLIGGGGDNTYYVDSSSDIVIEDFQTIVDHDKVISSATITLLATNVEDIDLIGSANINATGNALANRMIGNAGDNILDGGAFWDIMAGGSGNDTYVVDATGDSVTEGTQTGSGIDSVQAYISYTLGANLENLRLFGSTGINGTGTNFNNILTGNAAAIVLNGLAGNDSLSGGDGNDNLFGGDDNDSLMGGAGGDVLDGGAGVDLATYANAAAGVSVSLANPAGNTGDAAGDTYVSIENLTGSSFNDTFNGNTSANTIAGGAGNDGIRGNLGNDVLWGQAGSDIFHFLTALNATTNVDQIMDFSVVDDGIWLEDAVFTALSAGALSAAAFAANATGLAGDASDRVIYETDTGKLFYDADGTGAIAGVQFATLTVGLALTAADFLVI